MKASALDRRASEPIYKQIGKQVLRDIRTGELPPGAILPSLSEFKKLYPGVGRVTLVNAMATLVREGHLIARHGKGYFVNEPHDEETRVAAVLPLFSVYIQIYARFIARLQMGVEELGDRLWVMDSQERVQDFIEACEELVYRWAAKSLVVIPPCCPGKGDQIEASCAAYLMKLAKSGMIDNLVVFDRKVEDGLISVRQNRTAGRKLLLERASEKGMSKVLFIMSGLYPTKERNDLRTCGKRLGLEVTFVKSGSPEENLSTASTSGADVVLTDSDIYAVRICTAFGGGAPGFKLAGYDATNYALLHKPCITSVDPGLCAGADFITAHIKGELDKEKDRVFIMPPSIVEGKTF